MAYSNGQGSFESIKGVPLKKPRKKKPTFSRAAAPTSMAKSGDGYTTTNTSGNSRNGQKYRSVTTSKGVIHQYADGTSVLVKKKKGAAAGRSYH